MKLEDEIPNEERTIVCPVCESRIVTCPVCGRCDICAIDSWDDEINTVIYMWRCENCRSEWYSKGWYGKPGLITDKSGDMIK